MSDYARNSQVNHILEHNVFEYAHTHELATNPHVGVLTELEPKPAYDIFRFANDFGIDLAQDGMSGLGGEITASLNQAASGFIRQPNGVSYHYFQIDYSKNISGKNRLKNSRVVTLIEPGDRTELAFWHAGTPKHIEVHQGGGYLKTVQPGESQETAVLLSANIPASNTAVISDNSFYSVEVPANSDPCAIPLVISTLYDVRQDRSKLETVVQAAASPWNVPQGFLKALGY